MAARIDAFVKPRLITWARETAGFDIDVAARQLGVAEGRLAEWESGARHPSVAQLRNAAHHYRRPLAAFYLSEPPPEKPLPHDFRTRHPGDSKGLTSGLLLEMRRARYRRRMALELAAELDLEVPQLELTARVEQDAISVASRARRALAVEPETQFTWRDTTRALGAWSAAVERAGALVGQMSGLPVAEVRGFSVSDRPLPVIVVNGKDRGGRVFTLMHEVTHVLLRGGALCDLRERARGRSADAQVERFCNQVAAEILVPRSVFLTESLVANSDRRHDWSLAELRTLATRFSVSRDVVLRRLLETGKITRERFATLSAQLEAQYKEQKRQGGGGPAPAVLAIRNSGQRFTELVVRALEREHLQRTDAARLMGIGLAHLSDVESRVGTR